MAMRALFLRASCALLLAGSVGAFQLPAAPLRVGSRARVSVGMGLGDMFKNAFSNKDYSTSPAMYEQTSARALHILVEDEAQAQSIKEEIAGGLDFMEAAMKYSTCNSAARGGDLGKFTPGKMVKLTLTLTLALTLTLTLTVFRRHRQQPKIRHMMSLPLQLRHIHTWLGQCE